MDFQQGRYGLGVGLAGNLQLHSSTCFTLDLVLSQLVVADNR